MDIWKELKLDYFFDYRQSKDSKIKFKVKDIPFSLLTPPQSTIKEEDF
jgi:hypothetical protein